MALTQEEIRIRAGLDYSKVTAGLMDIRSQVYKLASDVPKKLGSILKANVYMMAGDLLTKFAEKATEAWLDFYGGNPAVKEAKAKAAKDIADFGKETLAAFEKASKAYKDAEEKFKNGGRSDEQRLTALRAESDEIRKQIKLKEDEIKRIDIARDAYRPGSFGFSFDEANKLAIEQKKLLADILNLKTKMLGVDSEAADLNRKTIEAIGKRAAAAEAAPQAMPTAPTSPEAPERSDVRWMKRVKARADMWQAHMDRINGRKPAAPPATPPPTGSPDNPFTVNIKEIKE